MGLKENEQTNSNTEMERCCNKCGKKVKKVKSKVYPYECLNCDENKYGFETHLKETYDYEKGVNK